jgi:hypothetical protein
MRVLIWAAGAALTLTACNKTDSPTDDMNAADNMMVDENAMMANDTGGMDANAATNAGEEANMMANDLATNDADTNLANGM